MPNQTKPKNETTPQEKLIAALIEFQQTCPSIAKDKEGFGYKYTPLEKFLSVVNPTLHKVGLVQHQTYDFEGDRTIIVTTLSHRDGASIISRLPVREPLGKNPKKDVMHEWGGITTYSRRYALKMILGLEPDMDMNLEDVIERDEPNPKISSTPKRANSTQAKKAAKNIIAAATPSSNDPERKANEDERSKIKGQVTEFLKTHGDSWPSVVTHFNLEFNKDGDKIFENVTQLKHCLFLIEKMTGIINASR